MNRRATLVLALALLSSLAIAVVPAAASNPNADNYTYRVTVENVSGNQTVTPVVAATHDQSFRLFRPGHEASNGIQQLAENGGVPVLAGELEASSNTAGVAVLGSAPIAPGEYVSGLISTDAGHRRLSLAAMLICTNDGFAGNSSMVLPGAVGAERTYYANSFDAGTEINTEAYADLVPPCDGLGQTGATNPDLAENGVVSSHHGIVGDVGDLTVADHDWTDPALKITVERVRIYTVTITNLTSGQPLTPAVFATHDPGVNLFAAGTAASNGIQQLAENGGVPVLVDELNAGSGVGTVAVVGSAPIAGGNSAYVEVVSDDTYGVASLAGMLICTNDGFGGVDSLSLPHYVGQQTHAYGAAYDAGTELNTEAYVDLVPPCDGLGQTGASNPDLAEGGVVSMHGGIVGGADLDPAIHGWDGAVLSVTVERTG